MSTWIYLRCDDHTPPIMADGESGQHLYDLPQTRADITDRAAVVTAWLNDEFDGDDHYFRRNTARFLACHPECRLSIHDEYGTQHALTDVPPLLTHQPPRPDHRPFDLALHQRARTRCEADHMSDPELQSVHYDITIPDETELPWTLPDGAA